jgi:hypothetical protein
VSRQSAIGKRAWRHRAPGYAAELRTAIEQPIARLRAAIEHDASARFAAWQARGRLPLWFRFKRRLRATIVRARARQRS